LPRILFIPETRREVIMADDKIARVPRSFTLMPSSLGEAMEIAKLISDSDFAPKDYKGKPANVMIAIQMGADVGLKPMQALQNIAVINGRPSIWGDAALALCLDVLADINETLDGEGDARKGTCTVKREGMPTPVVRTFSVADAKRAGLWGKAGPWQTYPDRMLSMRARGFALRDCCADCLMGLILAEEAEDLSTVTVIDVTPSVPPAILALERLPDEVREHIKKAFETLQMGIPADAAAPWHVTGLGLSKLNEFLGGDNPDAGAAKLIEWCKDEYAKRQGKTRKPKGDGNGKGESKASDAGTQAAAPVGQNDAPRPGGGSPTVQATTTAVVADDKPKPVTADEIFTPGEAKSGSFVGF
jgi:hypothetical protein